MRRILRWPRPSRPLLSVVLPVFNNAAHLDRMLTDVLEQPVRDLEVMVVDDGSTDGSAEIAADRARIDSRVRVRVQPNSGVSIARNVAVQMCRGDFLTFVDGDDALPPDAWSPMLRSLEETGSDFAVGKAEREDLRGEEPRRFVMPMMRRNHARRRTGVTLSEAPLMLADVFVWNKVFRTEFYRAAGIHFPERTRYQDQVAMTQAFIAARAFDVLTEVVYFWRVRPEGNSATQRRADLSNVRERFATKQMTLSLIEAQHDPHVHEVLLDQVLVADMWEHFRAGAVADEEYWDELVTGTRAIWHGGTIPFEETAAPAAHRLMGWLTVRDRRADLARWLELLAETSGPRFSEGGRLEHPWQDEVDIWRTVPRAH